MHVVLVAGTHGWDGKVKDWYSTGSPFIQRVLEPAGFTVLNDFVWSTALGGVGWSDREHSGWHAAGLNLLAYVVPPRCQESRIAPNDLLILTHSHGLQVALYAFAHGLRGMLLDVSGPVRKDMDSILEQARPNISKWVHVHSDKSDRWQIFGGLFDGRLGITRAHASADHNVKLSEVGHTGLLQKPELFHHWTESILPLVL